MIKIRIIALLALPVFISNICFAKDRIVAKYKDKNVLKSQIVGEIKEIYGKLPDNKKDFDDYDARAREHFIYSFIQTKLLADAADSAKTYQDSNYKKQLNLLKKQLMVKTYLENYVNKKTTPLMVRDAYNQYVDQLKEKDELKISHILLKTEAEANKILAEIKAGKISLGEAAKKYSIDPASKDKGGELGFISPGQTVPEFENTAYNLKKGSISAPVKTNFGWHIIQRLDSRKRKIPAFNKIKKEIEQQVKRGLIQQYISELTRNAKIEIVPKKK
ncbi:MAG: peptidylprolyl isomerase [Rickettsiales bacterium]|nr:peptidylprolyl isomerase [Rickettsiales bacterium]